MKIMKIPRMPSLAGRGPRSLSLTCCPKCGGEGKIWDFSDHEEPSFEYCDLCRGKACLVGN